MKKKYIIPEMTVVKLEMKSVILQGSLPMSDVPTIDSADDILSRENIFNNDNTWDENW